MIQATRSITDLIVTTFRLNGELLAAGDRLVRDIGLTSARWQVLGAIDLSPVPLPVAHIARNMGLSRQAVQRVTNDLAADGLVRLAENPHHARARLVVMTDAGRAAFSAAMARQRPWAARLAAGLDDRELATAARVLRRVLVNLEAAAPGGKGAGHAAQEHA